jgi:hypothetical protein
MEDGGSAGFSLFPYRAAAALRATRAIGAGRQQPPSADAATKGGDVMRHDAQHNVTAVRLCVILAATGIIAVTTAPVLMHPSEKTAVTRSPLLVSRNLNAMRAEGPLRLGPPQVQPAPAASLFRHGGSR